MTAENRRFDCAFSFPFVFPQTTFLQEMFSEQCAMRLCALMQTVTKVLYCGPGWL